MDSACCVYAIAGRDTPLPTAGSVGALAGLAMVQWRELTAVTGWVSDDVPRFTMEGVLHHEAVVEAVRERGPALPVRFGTIFRDTNSVASALAEHYEPLAADLERLGDKVELSLTALWPAPLAGNGPTPMVRAEGVSNGQSAGARYLYTRAAKLRRDESLRERAHTVARDLDQTLGALALERKLSLLPTPHVAIRSAYLMDPAGVGVFKAVFEATRRVRDEVRLLLTGPWPPYSFVRRPGYAG